MTDAVRPYRREDFTPGSRGHHGWCSNQGCQQAPVVTERRHRVHSGAAYYAHCYDHVWDLDWRQAHASDIADYHFQQRLERFGEMNDRIWGEGNWIVCGTCPPDDGGWPVFHHKDAHA